MGRPPKPTALRILSGNPGRRPLPPHEAKPAIPSKLPSAPSFLLPEARREWRRTGRKLLAVGLLTELDRAEFAAYCQSWARWQEAEDAIARFGTLYVDEAKTLRRSPWLMVANRAQADMRSAAASFGMSPSSRSRVVAAQPVEIDEFAAMFDSPRGS